MENIAQLDDWMENIAHTFICTIITSWIIKLQYTINLVISDCNIFFPPLPRLVGEAPAMVEVVAATYGHNGGGGEGDSTLLVGVL